MNSTIYYDEHKHPLKLSTSWEDCKKKKYRFPIIKYTQNFEISRVHPLHQAGALALHNTAADDQRIAKIILFGGSTTVRCHSQSDYDLFVFLKPDYCNTETKNQVSEALQLAVEWNADILWADSISPKDSIYEYILKGVEIL